MKKKNPTRTVTKNISTPEVASSLDLRGQTVEEALMEVDSFLDRASRMHLSQVTIIHGKGTGALRAAVQQHLRRCAQVKSFRLGTYGRRGKRRHHRRAEVAGREYFQIVKKPGPPLHQGRFCITIIFDYPRPVMWEN